MTDFTVHCRTEPDAQAWAGYFATYGIRIGGDDAYLGHLFRQQGEILPSRFETLAAGFRSFEVNQTHRVGLRKVEVREAFAGQCIGELRDLKLYFEGSNQIVGLHDPTPLFQRLARNAFNGRPERFIFRRAIDRSAIGWMETPRIEGGIWPVRLVRNPRPSRADQDAPVWQGQFNCPDLDGRLFIAAAVILHSDRGRLGG